MIDPQAVLVLLGIITGLVGMPIVNWLKALLGWEDKYALALASGVSILLGVGVAFANGVFTGIGTDPVSIFNAITAVFATATLYYKFLVSGKPAEQPEEPEA